MPENKFLDDIAKFGNTTLNAMGTMQKQVRSWVSEQVETLIKNMDLVTKKDMEAHNLGASRLLARVEELEKRVQDLEGQKAASKPKTASKTKPKAE